MRGPRPNRATLEGLNANKGRSVTDHPLPVFGGGERTERKMNMWKGARRFHADESGAVTVDWVVLTAGVVTLVLVAMAGLKGKMTTIGERTEDFLSSQTINTTF